MVLEDVTEFDYSSSPTKLSKVLLNGNNICMVSAACQMTRQCQTALLTFYSIYGSLSRAAKVHRQVHNGDRSHTFTARVDDDLPLQTTPRLRRFSFMTSPYPRR